MKKIEYIPKFTVSGKAMRLIMEIAAALERYKIVMEGPDGVRLRKLNQSQPCWRGSAWRQRGAKLTR